MKIITISGAHSGVGKTMMAEQLLRNLKGWAALKVTVARKDFCPREKACGVCKEQKAPFTIISDPRIINQEGKDTQRMKHSGAKKVLWLKATPMALKDGLREALKRFKGPPGIVIEGTSILKYLKPDLGVFIDDKRRIKLLKCS